jgi:MFS family permease
MTGYLSVLRIADYRKLWVGSLLSLLGDGATWTALAWLALGAGGTKALGVIGICYTLPVMVGGAVVGPLLDRFSRRTLLVADNVVRGLVVASVPVAAAVGEAPLGMLYAVAAVYGLFKIVPLGVVPAVVPDLVPADKLQPAAALETVGYGVAGLAGPALGGLLIPVIGGEGVLAIDAVSYGLFALLVLSMTARLPRPEPVVAELVVAAPLVAEPVVAVPAVAAPAGTGPVRTAPAGAGPAAAGPAGAGQVGAGSGAPAVAAGHGWMPAIRLLTGDRVLVSITLSFLAFNFVFGMLTVTSPWLVKFEFGDHPQLLGLLLATLSGAELVGSFAGGMLKPVDRTMLRMGLLQICAGLGLVLLFARSLPMVLLALLVLGVLSGPVTVSSMALRMSRIPAAVRGRTMTLMRTLMNASPPLGAAVAGILLSAGSYTGAVWVMVLAASTPGVLVAWAYRNTSFAAQPAPVAA